jgi:hypothetical protein
LNGRRVFLSYHRAAAAAANTLANTLRSLRYEPWLDVEQLDLTQSLSPQLVRAITSSDLFLRVVTSQDSNSYWVRFETHIALQTLGIDRMAVLVWPADSAAADRQEMPTCPMADPPPRRACG